ncbi:hypothetical protein ILYODFUR_038009 [Ilyodon furcidens]|uniref:Uncharacterized protein n=1 Tax=Ilyodon furcidens TaxID=33524 RepID=A0ABV0TQ86_9TELE
MFQFPKMHVILGPKVPLVLKEPSCRGHGQVKAEDITINHNGKDTCLMMRTWGGPKCRRAWQQHLNNSSVYLQKVKNVAKHCRYEPESRSKNLHKRCRFSWQKHSIDKA